ncbi:MAG TPA: inositol monophosphatase family protein [Actinomycetota bacterium]|nr:inositol monophosphatase family protein [Actinomycetota bacterium]
MRFANHLADVADSIAMRFFRMNPGVRMKQDGSPVTEADEAVEKALRQEILASFPRDAVVGEEEGAAAGTSGRRWILDPIDGTKNYSFGIPVWATLIALEERGEVVAGVVSAPAIAERYEAARGSGARRNGETLSVSGVSSLPEARVSYGSFSSFEKHGRGEGFLRLIRTARWSRGFGDFWGHMLVAGGHVDVMAEPQVNVWDLAPLLVIVEEAGGRFTDLSGARRPDGGSALSTNGLLHEAALESLGLNVMEP